MALNIKKLETISHPEVSSVKLTMKVRRLTTEDSAKSDYANKSYAECDKEKELVELEQKEKVTPIKKLDLV